MRNSVDYIYKELSKKHNVSEECIKTLEKEWWRSVMREVSSGSGKRVTIPNFGSLYVDVYNVNSAIFRYGLAHEKLERDFKEGKLEQMFYLRKWLRIHQALFKLEQIKNNMQKRDVREKGERGL